MARAPTAFDSSKPCNTIYNERYICSKSLTNVNHQVRTCLQKKRVWEWQMANSQSLLTSGMRARCWCKRCCQRPVLGHPKAVRYRLRRRQIRSLPRRGLPLCRATSWSLSRPLSGPCSQPPPSLDGTESPATMGPSTRLHKCSGCPSLG